MKPVDIIPSIKKESFAIESYLKNISSRFDIDPTEKDQYIHKAKTSIHLLKQAEKIILNGTNFDIGEFEERGYVNSPDYKVANILSQMKIGMPYPEFTLSVSIQTVNNTALPMIFIIKTIIIQKVSYFIIIPLFIKKGSSSKEISHSISPPVIPIGSFQDNNLKEIDEIKNDEIQSIIKEDSTLQIIRSKHKEEISTYAFSYLFFDESLNDKKIKIQGTNFMNHFMQEYFMKFLLLLNTKGVTTETIPAPKALNKKRIKNNKFPISEHKVLKFQLPKKNKSKSKSARSDAISIMPLHSVIGHTKIYDNDKPLFGSYVGSVWCPSYLRGDESKGHITKDYKLTKK